MSVLLETSLGDIVIDLETELCPKSCQNFLKLCQAHYYKLNAFFSVQRDFLAQTGDPTNTGDGGVSVWSRLPSSSSVRTASPYFTPETHPTLKHRQKGTISFACTPAAPAVGGAKGSDEDADLVAGSQFFVTLKDEIGYLDGKHAPFGTVVEGQEPGGTLDKINQAFTDEKQRPLKDIRIRHVVVLEDPFPDPEGFVALSRSPSPTPEQVRALRLADDEDLEETRDAAEIEESRRLADSSAAALTLEMVGDLPFAEIRPPENILFVCKLNPVTRSEDLELIFLRFGRILSCEVIKDKKTGDSLQYAFIEFDKKEDAERAYFKMQNVLVDDKRIWVDFSQSVSKLHGDWLKKCNGGREVPDGYYQGGNRTQNDGARGGGGGGGRYDRDMVFDFQEGHRSDRRDGRDRRPPPHRSDDRSTAVGRSGERYRGDDGGRRDSTRRDDMRYDDQKPSHREGGRRDDRSRRSDHHHHSSSGRSSGKDDDRNRDRNRDRERGRDRERDRDRDSRRSRDPSRSDRYGSDSGANAPRPRSRSPRRDYHHSSTSRR